MPKIRAAVLNKTSDTLTDGGTEGGASGTGRFGTLRRDAQLIGQVNEKVSVKSVLQAVVLNVNEAVGFCSLTVTITATSLGGATVW